MSLSGKRLHWLHVDCSLSCEYMTHRYRPDCNCYFIFRGSGENHHESWQFDLTFVKNVSPNDKSADEEVRFRWTGKCFPNYFWRQCVGGAVVAGCH